MTEITFELLDKNSHTHMRAFTKFHNTIFPNTQASQEWIEWYCAAGNLHHGVETRVYVARRADDNEIVGSWCIEPKRFCDGKKNVPTGRCFSVGIHPDVRRQNLFVRLSKHAIEAERHRKDYKVILGFPQVGRPVIPAHIKSGWREHSVIPMLGKKPENYDCSLRYVRRHTFEEINTIPYSEQVQSYVESPSYFRRRWLDHPDNDYIVLATKDSPHSTIVLKHYGSVMHVLSIRGGKASARLLLKAASTLAFRHNCSELNAWGHASDVYYNSLIEHGFAEGVSASPNIQLMCVDLDESYHLDSLENCALHQGIEEIY